jgi:hypothetical protein
MKLIAHRGLINGPDVNLENRPEQIELTLTQGFDCEIDLWVINAELYLGHDRPDYPIDKKFLDKFGLWIHAKNLAALRWLTDTSLYYFWHQEDDFTLTSSNHIWTYPGKHLTNKSIAVMPERDDEYWEYVKNLDIIGVCTDYVEKFIYEVGTMPVRSTEKLR